MEAMMGMFRRDSPVLLLLADGSMKIYTRAVRVAEVQAEFPGHRVWLMASSGSPQPSKKVLSPGKTYCLVPVADSATTQPFSAEDSLSELQPQQDCTLQYIPTRSYTATSRAIMGGGYGGERGDADEFLQFLRRAEAGRDGGAGGALRSRPSLALDGRPAVLRRRSSLNFGSLVVEPAGAVGGLQAAVGGWQVGNANGELQAPREQEGQHAASLDLRAYGSSNSFSSSSSIPTPRSPASSTFSLLSPLSPEASPVPLCPSSSPLHCPLESAGSKMHQHRAVKSGRMGLVKAGAAEQEEQSWLGDVPELDSIRSASSRRRSLSDRAERPIAGKVRDAQCDGGAVDWAGVAPLTPQPRARYA